jgi:hypothetical protein
MDPMTMLSALSALTQDYQVHMNEVLLFDNQNCKLIQGELDRFSDAPAKLVKSTVQLATRQTSTSSSSSAKSGVKRRLGSPPPPDRHQYNRRRLDDDDARKKIQRKKKTRR